MSMSSEGIHFVPGFKSADHTAGIDSTSINMGKVHRAILAIQLGDMSVASPEVIAYSGATTGTKTTPLAFRYKLSPQPAATAGSDIWTAGYTTVVAADGLTVVFDTDDNKLLLIEVDSAEMTEGEPWLTINLDADATISQAAAVWICDARYDQTVTVLT